MTDASTQELIRAVQQAASSASLISAVRNLAAAEDEAAISTLIAVLGYNNPAAAVAAVEGLIALKEVAVQPLIEQLDQYDYGARAYAIRALAAIADPRALDLLVTAATDFAPSVRRAALAGLGKLHWSGLNVSDRPQAQDRAFQTLLSVFQDLDWSIRYAAVVGLQALSMTTNLQAQIQLQLQQITQTESDTTVQARISLAQQLLSTDIKTG